MGNEQRIEIRRYDETDMETWDDFIFQKAINGTFLQSRRFLNYHPIGRFEDYSLMIYLKGKLVAVCPACRVLDSNRAIFVSHQGSTYGGIIIIRELMRLELAMGILNELHRYLLDDGFYRIVLKPTMDLLCSVSDKTFDYAFRMCGYTELQELNLLVDYSNLNADIISNYSKLKKRQVNKCIKDGMMLKELKTENDLENFHSMLSDNLKKFDKEPVHTVKELVDLKNRFPDNIFFFGGYINSELLSGTMVFDFSDVKCAHTQYLASKNVIGNLSPMSFIYHSMTEHYYDKGYKYLSWGIATEHNGDVNWGLMRNKEEYGSTHCINRVFEKNLV